MDSICCAGPAPCTRLEDYKIRFKTMSNLKLLQIVSTEDWDEYSSKLRSFGLYIVQFQACSSLA